MSYEKIRCPECKEYFNGTKNECECGWKKENYSTSRDSRCIFVLNGKRCRLLGTHSSATQKNDDWRCQYHFDSQGDFQKSSRLLDFIEHQFHEIIHFRKHYSTNFKNCERCKKLCDAENDFSKNEYKDPGEIIF